MKQRGITLIEIMVLIAIAMIVIMIFSTGISGISATKGVTYGVNGLMETRCVEGYKVLVGQTGHPIQMLDKNGNGITCDTELKLIRGE